MENRNELMAMGNELAMANIKTEKVGKVTTEFYEFERVSHDKEGKEVRTTIQIRDKATVLALSNIDFFAGMTTLSLKGFVGSMAKISREEAKKAGFKSVVDMVAHIHKEYSKTTLNLYRRIGLLFIDQDAEGFQWRPGIAESVSVNNLSVVLALACNGTKDLEELSKEELEDLYERFYADYIATGDINLTAPQSQLKKAVRLINSGIIEGQCKESVGQNVSAEDGQNVSANDGQNVSKESAYKDMLADMSEFYKSNDVVLKAISDLIKAISEVQ